MPSVVGYLRKCETAPPDGPSPTGSQSLSGAQAEGREAGCSKSGGASSWPLSARWPRGRSRRVPSSWRCPSSDSLAPIALCKGEHLVMHRAGGAKARDLFAATRVCQARIGVPDFVTSYLNSSADWNSKLQMAGAAREIAS